MDQCSDCNREVPYEPPGSARVPWPSHGGHPRRVGARGTSGRAFSTLNFLTARAIA